MYKLGLEIKTLELLSYKSRKEFEEALEHVLSNSKKVGYDIELVTITRPSAYGEYEPYHFVNSYEEFENKVSIM